MLKYSLTHIIWESDGLDEVSLLFVGWPLLLLLLPVHLAFVISFSPAYQTAAQILSSELQKE